MANKKISQLTPLNATPDANDILPLNDTSAGSTFSVKVSELQAATQSLASNLTDISTIAQANGTMIASDGTNFVSLGGIDTTGLSVIRADLGLGTAATTASTAYATAAQGTTADSAVQTELDPVVGAVNGIVKANGSGVISAAVSGTDYLTPTGDGSQLTNLPASAVDGTAVTSTGETGATKFLREDGDGTCSFNDIVVGDAQLRGTTNPHIGAFPNQSLKVIDNPSQSVVVVTDSDGNLDFVVKTDSSKAYLNTPSARLELTTGVSVVEDATEPDIEITTTSGTYSLITGDSDALGANGLPIRQGFNTPDIGANPSPLLISGGTIS